MNELRGDELLCAAGMTLCTFSTFSISICMHLCVGLGVGVVVPAGVLCG